MISETEIAELRKIASKGGRDAVFATALIEAVEDSAMTPEELDEVIGRQREGTLMRCDRCAADLTTLRKSSVQFTSLDGLPRRAILCSDCLGALREFLNGGDR